MQSQIGVLCLLVLGATQASSVEVTPVQKVTQLMQAMKDKGKKNKHDEQVAWSAKEQFCKDTKTDKTADISEEHQTIASLTAKIKSQKQKIADQSKKIADTQKDADTWDGDIKAAEKVRALEKSDFDTTNKDYGESIGALGPAITTMKAKTADKKQSNAKVKASALMQVSSQNLIPDSAKKAIDEFVQQGDAESELFDEAGPPEANAYESQSGGIIDMLSKLEDKFVDERTALRKTEVEKKHAHEMLVQNLESQIKEANKDIRDFNKDKQKTVQAKAAAESDKKDQEKLLASDTKYLKDLTASCSVDKAEYEASQQMRADEITAIDKAISIISSGSVKGAADKHLPSMLQERKAPSFGQLRSSQDSNHDSLLQTKAAKFLHEQAAKLNSRVLETIAVKTVADPLKKVKNMIKDLIQKLMEEANAEAEHKGFCDTSLSTNEVTRNSKTEEVDSLNAEIKQLHALISKLMADIKKLGKQVAALDNAMQKSTEIRTAEKAKNKETVADSQEAQAAVASALTVLKAFYQKASDAAAMDASKGETEDSGYKGQASESTGVLGMLEVIESDFARLEAQTKASEATNQDEYDKYMTESKVDKAEKMASTKRKMDKKQLSESTLHTKESDLSGTEKELKAALNVFEKLKPSCIQTGMSYEDRVAKRKEEIESMKMALTLLNGKDEADR